ncbi:hypothetical protein AB0P13_18360 [Rhodococcus pyridinivorans]|uniref:hypothetical protein n=1 Tax=Rhodococcus pyridinivorans TaxID=103816 RepID=UPI003440D2E7
MTTLWMIEDLEPWPDPPAPGQVCEPTTSWITPGASDCIRELARHVPARVAERHPVIQRTRRIPTADAGWYGVEYEGPRTVHRFGPIPDGHSIVAYALLVTLQ